MGLSTSPPPCLPFSKAVGCSEGSIETEGISELHQTCLRRPGFAMFPKHMSFVGEDVEMDPMGKSVIII
jgi:hypothetical protein